MEKDIEYINKSINEANLVMDELEKILGRKITLRELLNHGHINE